MDFLLMRSSCCLGLTLGRGMLLIRHFVQRAPNARESNGSLPIIGLNGEKGFSSILSVCEGSVDKSESQDEILVPLTALNVFDLQQR